MSSSSNSNKTSSEETTKTVDDGSPSYGSNGRKLTPLPITTPNAKPGQNQAAVHKLSTTLEEEDELEMDSNENRNQATQQNLPKNNISSASLITSTSTGSSPNANEKGNT